MVIVTITETGTGFISSKIVREDRKNMDELNVIVTYDTVVSIGNEFKLYNENDTFIFGGYVRELKNNENKELLVYDYSSQLLDITINQTFNNKKPEEIAEQVVSDNTDLTFATTITSSTVITTVTYKDKRAWDVVNEMAEILNANFRTDKNKNFNLELSGENPATVAITTENSIIDDDWKEDGSQIVNDLIVKGTFQVFETSETFLGTGAADQEVTLNEFPIDVKVESPTGTEIPGFVTDVTTGSYSVDKENKVLTGTFAAAESTAYYTYQVPIKLRAKNEASESAYGKRTRVVEKKYINSFNEARNFADFYLGRFSDPLLSSVWKPNAQDEWESFIPTYNISVTDNIRNISGNFIIKKIEREFPGEFVVSIGEPEDDIIDWNKEVQQRVKQLEEKDDNSQILQFYDNVQNNVTLGVEITIPRYQYRNKENCFYLGDDDNGLLREAGTPYDVIMCEENSGNTWIDVT